MVHHSVFCRFMLLSGLCLVVLTLGGCVSKPEPVIKYQQFLSSRINDQGTQEFAYGLAWRWDRDFVERWREQQLELSGNMRTPRLNARELIRPTLNAQQRLSVEEDAVRGLPRALAEQGLCPNGHHIDDVIWETGRVRLMGYCLD